MAHEHLPPSRAPELWCLVFLYPCGFCSYIDKTITESIFFTTFVVPRLLTTFRLFKLSQLILLYILLHHKTYIGAPHLLCLFFFLHCDPFLHILHYHTNVLYAVPPGRTQPPHCPLLLTLPPSYKLHCCLNLTLSPISYLLTFLHFVFSSSGQKTNPMVS